MYPPNNCDTCFGFGLWPDNQLPAYEIEAREGHYFDPCPDCGSDNTFYEIEAEKAESQKNISWPRIEKDFLLLLKERRCVELSDIVEKKEMQQE